jgi:hypothetical protein
MACKPPRVEQHGPFAGHTMNNHTQQIVSKARREDLDEFVACYNPADRHHRRPTFGEDNPEGRWRAYSYEELVRRDKANLDMFWLKDKALEDAASLPEPDLIAAEIAEDLQAAEAEGASGICGLAHLGQSAQASPQMPLLPSVSKG